MIEINAWWWRKDKIRNFGDELSAHILKKMGYKVRRVGLNRADMLIGGTTIDTAALRAQDGCTIWGAGAGWRHPIERNFDIRAVRGALTAECLQFEGVLGDPGLLVSRFWDKKPTRYGLGVVRHYVDKHEYPEADIVIEATEPVDQVIAKISACRTICSSSLHGLIVAASFGIPAMRISHSEVISGDIKWLDFQSALVKPIAQIQDELIKALWT